MPISTGYSSLGDLQKASSSINTMDDGTATKTEKGTKIIKKGQDFDKNAFLKILAAQMSNLDPTQQQDSTQYITQMAQFAAMEQMANLNETMTASANQALVGKGVTFKSDSDPTGFKTGIVMTATKSSTGTTLAVKCMDSDKQVRYYTVDVSDVTSVVRADDSDSTLAALGSLQGNTSFLLATNFMNKEVEFNEYDKNNNVTSSKGMVTGVYKKNGDIYCNVKLSNGEYKEVLYSNITKVGEIKESSSTTK